MNWYKQSITIKIIVKVNIFRKNSKIILSLISQQDIAIEKTIYLINGGINNKQVYNMLEIVKCYTL